MSIGNEVSRSFPGPDDDRPYIVRPREPRAPRAFTTQADVDALVRVGLWGPEEVAEYQRRAGLGGGPGK